MTINIQSNCSKIPLFSMSIVQAQANAWKYIRGRGVEHGDSAQVCWPSPLQMIILECTFDCWFFSFICKLINNLINFNF
jgi:hypothetical protein